MAVSRIKIDVLDQQFVVAIVRSGLVDVEGVWRSIYMPNNEQHPLLKRKPATARELLRRPEIKEYLSALLEQSASLAAIDAAALVDRWKLLAFADPRELITHRRVNCRHCWGVDHEYQWTLNEQRSAIAVAVDNAARYERPYKEPEFKGGGDFNHVRVPHPDCPECNGQGLPYVHVGDMNNLSTAGQALYKGVKQTKDGIEVLMHDQLEALKALSKFYGITPETMLLISKPSLQRPERESTTEENSNNAEAAQAAYERLMKAVPLPAPR